MTTPHSFARTHARVALLCTFTGAVISLSSLADAASTTLTISGNPAASATVNQPYSFQPIGHDTVTSRLKYWIKNKPSWAQFNETTGLLTGTPSRADVGTVRNIGIDIVDWYGYQRLPLFSITVTAAAVANTPPTITGRPLTSINVGSAYSFTPTASDADKNPLQFSIQNKPVWANFNTTSGALSGTVDAGDVGTYGNILITATDGKASTSLAAFTLTVNQIATGNATLDWTPPTENSDGSILTDLAGYRVHYGTSANSLTHTVSVTNPGLTSYVVDNLASGTWYFNMTSYSKAGTESLASGVVTATIL